MYKPQLEEKYIYVVARAPQYHRGRILQLTSSSALALSRGAECKVAWAVCTERNEEDRDGGELNETRKEKMKMREERR